jgi:hypothetical protein
MPCTCSVPFADKFALLAIISRGSQGVNGVRVMGYGQAGRKEWKSVINRRNPVNPENPVHPV